VYRPNALITSSVVRSPGRFLEKVGVVTSSSDKS
jgi:hypothetical protein